MIHDYLEKKIQESKEIIKLAADMSKEYYHQPLIVTYSGGKDSDVMLQLAIECLNPEDFEVMNSHTTVDAPETVYYIRDKFKELNEMGIKATVQYPHYPDGRFKSMWTLIVDKDMPPTRLARYCCAELKETSTPNRFVAIGVRQVESVGRKGREVFATRGKNKKEANYYTATHIREVFEDDKVRRDEEGIEANSEGVWDCNFITKAKRNDDLICQPIYKWTDNDVWVFIEDRGMKYNPLYDKGFYRVGCIGCPFSGNQKTDLEKYPKIKQNYINAFQRLVEKRKTMGLAADAKYREKWKDGESIYKWWIQDDSIEGQMDIFEFLKKEES